ncbi:MAG: hypothetical protein APF80_04485 [Alphaproteobacteria bacterium BRH_c36]|nr:MAG: hypothetical protein APF80_04485 [Alphaproteobacteria bacterium BRH_c36]
MFWKTVGRMILVPLAFMIGAAMAAFVLFTLGLERFTQSIHADEVAGGDIDQVFALIDQASLIFATFTIIPAIVFAIVGEVARIRSLLYYVIGGGVSMAVTPLLAQGVDGGPAVVWQVFAVSGFAGGFVYWLLAGRSAG